MKEKNIIYRKTMALLLLKSQRQPIMEIRQLYFLKKSSPKITSMMILIGIEYQQDGDLSTKKKP